MRENSHNCKKVLPDNKSFDGEWSAAVSCPKMRCSSIQNQNSIIRRWFLSYITHLQYSHSHTVFTVKISMDPWMLRREARITLGDAVPLTFTVFDFKLTWKSVNGNQSIQPFKEFQRLRSKVCRLWSQQTPRIWVYMQDLFWSTLTTPIRFGAVMRQVPSGSRTPTLISLPCFEIPRLFYSCAVPSYLHTQCSLHTQRWSQQM